VETFATMKWQVIPFCIPCCQQCLLPNKSLFVSVHDSSVRHTCLFQPKIPLKYIQTLESGIRAQGRHRVPDVALALEQTCDTKKSAYNVINLQPAKNPSLEPGRAARSKGGPGPLLSIVQLEADGTILTKPRAAMQP